jgi:hypothetical protein
MLLDYIPARRLVEQASILKRLSIQECLDAYATNFQSKYGSVVLISDDFSGINSSISRVYSQQVPSSHDYLETDPYRWICAERRGMVLEQPCSQYISDIRSRDDWVVYGYKVDRCLADMEGEKCTLEFSLPLAIAVIGTNFVKAVLIVLAPVLLSGAPILTVGDAIASFLRSPDKMTEDNCLLSRELVALKSKNNKVALFSSTMQKMATSLTCKLGALGVKVPSKFRFGSYTAQHPEESQKPAVYDATPKRRWSSLSLTRWVLCLFT